MDGVTRKKPLDKLLIKVFPAYLLLVSVLTLTLYLLPCRLYGFDKLVLVNGFEDKILYTQRNSGLGIGKSE